jgi:hypothetical protein
VSSKVDEDWNQGCEELLGYAETDSECAPANVPTEKKQLDLALTVLTRVAAYESMFTKSYETNPAQDADVSESLVAEYYILRTALVRGGISRIDTMLTLLQAWQQNNLGVAEQMYQKSMSSQQLFDPGTAESLADVLYELGKDMLNKQQYSLAIKWLERSYKVLEKQELERLSIDASELQTSIMQSLIKSLLASKETEATERARSLVALLEGVVGDKLVVLLLKLEILSAPTIETFDSESYSDILHRMARSMSLTDANFKLIMFHIRKLNDKSPSLACKALDELLRLRVLKPDEGREDYIEKILVTRLWITTSQTGSPDVLKSIDELFSHIASNVTKPISSAATLAAHTVCVLSQMVDKCLTLYSYSGKESSQVIAKDNTMRLKIGVIWLCIGYSRMRVNSTTLEFQGSYLQPAVPDEF